MSRIPAARAVVAVVLTLGVLALPAVLAPGAAAHALLVRAQPAANGTVASSPRLIVLTFSEPVDASLSAARIVDSRGRPAPGVAAARAVAGDPYQLRLALTATLPRGVYTVDWRTVSALDGHVAAGAYAFGVGVANVGTVAPFGRYASTAAWLTVVSAAGRFALYAGLAVLLGAVAVCLAAFHGRLPAGGGPLLWGGWLLAAAGVATVTLSERAIVRAPSLLPFFETQEGAILLLLGLTAAVICGIAQAAFGMLPRPATLIALGAAAGLTALVAVWGSHADARSAWRVANLADQWVHIVAVGAWVGGLPWLLLGLRGLDGPARVTAVRRFSALASIALAVVLLTGIARAVPEVGAPAALVRTSFGVTLLVKVALVAGLVALGAFNHFRSVPGLSRDAEAVGPLRRALHGEIGVSLAVLAVTGMLGGLAPAAVAASATKAGASTRVVLAGTDSASTVRVQLTITPGTVGRNEFVAHLADLTLGGALAGVDSIELDFTLPSQPAVAPITVALARASDGTWRGSARAPTVAGRWSIAVVVERVQAVVVPLTLQARVQ